MRIMSGIQPTGNLHIGNYLGALKTWVDLQQKYECFFSIVDLHALTRRSEAATLRHEVREMVLGVLAAGVDPERAVVFVQSHVPGHAELGWVLSCMTQLGDLNRMTQFKDKSQSQPDNINAGLFTYPVLQTADIAIYRAEGVPVGEDQVQHLELSREILRRFNGLFGKTFPEPKAILSPAPRVMGIDGETKMSKSKGNEIGLFEEPDAIMAKLRRAKTDPARLTRSDAGNPDVCNVFSYHGFFSDEATRTRIDGECRSASIGCVDCKKLLCDAMDAELRPIRERAATLRAEPERLDAALVRGAERASAEAAETMAAVRERVGLR